MKTITAKFPGTCFLCEGRFTAGESISMYTKWSHTECAKREAEKQAAEDHEADAWQRDQMAAFKRGEHATVHEVHGEIVVRNAPSYAFAKDLAFAFIENAQVATGFRHTLNVKVRNGKRYVGRELRFGGHGGTMTYHDGWAFPYRVHGVAA